jgi:hypothetical protein
MNSTKKIQTEFGQANIHLIETKQGYWGLHGDTDWDATMFWKFYPAYLVLVSARGLFDWGPVKYRSNAQLEHKGTSEIKITEGELYVAMNGEIDLERNKAEEKVKGLEEFFTDKGFDLQITEEEDFSTRLDLRRKIQWYDNKLPKWAINKISKPDLKSLYLKE